MTMSVSKQNDKQSNETWKQCDLLLSSYSARRGELKRFMLILLSERLDPAFIVWRIVLLLIWKKCIPNHIISSKVFWASLELCLDLLSIHCILCNLSKVLWIFIWKWRHYISLGTAKSLARTFQWCFAEMCWLKRLQIIHTVNKLIGLPTPRISDRASTALTRKVHIITPRDPEHLVHQYFTLLLV